METPKTFEISENSSEKAENVFDKERLRRKLDDRYDVVVFGADNDNEGKTGELLDVVITGKDDERKVSLYEYMKDINSNVSITAAVKNFVSGLIASHNAEGSIVLKGIRLSLQSLERLSGSEVIFHGLHEIGHLADYTEKDDENKRSSAELRGALSHLQYLGEDLKNMPDYFKEKIISEERKAWAEAILLARRIKKEHGIDLFKYFGDVDNFMGFVRQAGLESYEDVLGLPKTKEKQFKLWGKRRSRKKVEKFFEPLFKSIEKNVKEDFIEKTF